MNHTLSLLHLQTTKEFCFLLLQKGEQFVLMHYFSVFSAPVCAIMGQHQHISNQHIFSNFDKFR
jgi:hypothetical protein